MKDDKLTSVDHGVLSDNTEFGGIGLNDLEFDGTHTATDKERVTLSDGTISCQLIN